MNKLVICLSEVCLSSVLFTSRSLYIKMTPNLTTLEFMEYTRSANGYTVRTWVKTQLYLVP